MVVRNDAGYVMIYVGKYHHLANSQGWAREHRVVMERSLGRKLGSKEVVHHKNGDKTDNRPENLELYVNNATHMHCHAEDPSALRPPGAKNEMVPCACGCGGLRREFGSDGYRDRYIRGHHLKRRAGS